MEKFRISRAMRFFFVFAGSVLWLGIGLTGFSVVNWLLYVPAIFFAFAALTGICPGLILARLIFPETR
ncbi:MAG: hypothetical protein M0Z84_03750 [Gammaproteobacteria bacterium]|nr:hypothetical protein [Gammaproteobacteria bacterium]